MSLPRSVRAAVWVFCLGASIVCPAQPATNLWQFPLPILRAPIRHRPLRPTERFIRRPSSAISFAVTPDGRLKWTFKAGREIKSSPAIADDGTIYFGSRDWKFYAVSAQGRLEMDFPDRRVGGFVPGHRRGRDDLFRLLGHEFLRAQSRWHQEMESSPAAASLIPRRPSARTGRFISGRMTKTFTRSIRTARKMGLCHRRPNHLVAGHRRGRDDLFQFHRRESLRAAPGRHGTLAPAHGRRDRILAGARRAGHYLSGGQ